MKKTSTTLLLIAFISAVTISSCKKKEDPTPAAVTVPVPVPVTPTPPINQPSTTAPSLHAGTNTTLNTTTGSGNSGIVNLSDVVTDPQGDYWTIASVTSSNTSVATIEKVSEGSASGFKYTGLTSGTATFTIVVTDAGGHTNTLTYTITITQSPNAPTLNAGVNTSFSVQAGSNVFWNLSDKVTDPQGDNWTVTGIVSSNTSILKVDLDDSQIIEYEGVNAGNATMTVTLSDASNNTSTFTATVSVAAKPVGPKAVEVK